MFGDYGYNRIVGFEPQWVRKGVKCPKPEHVSKKLKEICSFFSEAGQDTVSLVMPKIKESKSNNKPDYSKMYFTLEAVDDCNFAFFGKETLVDFLYIMSMQLGQEITKEQIRQMIIGDWEGIQYSVDGGKTWHDTEPTTITISGLDVSALSAQKINAGNTIMLKGVNDGLYLQDGAGIDFPFNNLSCLIDSDGGFNAYGNIMSIAYGDNFIGQKSMQEKGFFGLFASNDSKIISAKNLILPATTLSDGCYSHMFDYCQSLTSAPELPATTLASGCYSGMFFSCKSLTTAPELPAGTLADNCYSSMFSYCTSLNYIKCLATNISASNCTYNWVSGVANSGTFVKAIEDWPTGNDGIPSGWTVEDYR